jgi:hypothetical protein
LITHISNLITRGIYLKTRAFDLLTRTFDDRTRDIPDNPHGAIAIDLIAVTVRVIRFISTAQPPMRSDDNSRYLQT